jgi:hypothetical protein
VGRELRSDLSLSIAVGFGTAHVATLAAGGHRFFVVGGAEVQLATDCARAWVAHECRCEVLISASVQQEVQYAFKCFPRLWFEHHLMYEPIQAVGEATADEWMYELRRLHDVDGEYNASTLMPVFMMVHSHAAPAAIERAVADLRIRHSGALSPQDVASLDHLLTTLPIAGRAQ